MLKAFRNRVRAAGLLVLLLFTATVWAQDEEADTVLTPPLIREVRPDDVPAPSHNFGSASATQPPEVRTVPDSELDALRADDDYWYANIAPPEKKKPQVTNAKPVDRSWVGNVLWILIVVAFTGIVIWYLVTSNIILFRRTPKPLAENNDEGIPEDIFEIDYDKEIQRAIDTGNLRLATRLYYLNTLRSLSNRELINFTHEKTNSDYLFQLADTPWYRDFFRLTRAFEYAWYGQFALSPKDFEHVQQDFIQFNRGLAA